MSASFLSHDNVGMLAGRVLTVAVAMLKKQLYSC